MQPNHVRFMACSLLNPFARPTTLMKLLAVRFHLSRSQFVHIYCPLDGPRTTPSRKSQRVSVSIQPCRYGCLAKKLFGSDDPGLCFDTCFPFHSSPPWNIHQHFRCMHYVRDTAIDTSGTDATARITTKHAQSNCWMGTYAR